MFEEHVVKMGFLNNLFKPKYKHSDWKIRREAVKEISDEKILIDIAKSDDSPKVREEAINNINNQAVLKEIIETDNDSLVQFFAFRNIENREDYLTTITDQWLLAKIAERDEDESIAIKAVRNMSDERLLAGIVENFRIKNNVRIEAAKKITDKEIIVDILSKKLMNESIKLEIIKNIDDEKTRTEIEKETQVKMLGNKLLTEKNTCNEDVYNMLISDKEFFYHDCIQIASQLESNGCDIMALLAYIDEDIKNSGFDEQTAWLNQKNIKYVEDNINRLRDKIGNELLPADKYEIKSFIKKMVESVK